MIRAIQSESGTNIEVEDDGTVFIGSREAEGTDEAARMIEEIVDLRRRVALGAAFDLLGPRGLGRQRARCAHDDVDPR